MEHIAKRFNISGGSMQKLLKELEAENVIRREPVYAESGKQKANRIVYTGDKPRLTGKEAQIEQVCGVDNPLRLRDFRWEGYWCMSDDEMFFHYEDYFGCDGTVPELNARARRNGYISSFDDSEFYESPEEYADKEADKINAELMSFAKRKRKKSEKSD